MRVCAIRGATTVTNNNAEEIIGETRALLEEIAMRNEIKTDDLISAIFTVTSDLNAAFPAVAARQIGWTGVALMDMTEIDVPGSLRKCIRVLLHINTEKSNKDLIHVYLKGAASLRPDLSDKQKIDR